MQQTRTIVVWLVVIVVVIVALIISYQVFQSGSNQASQNTGPGSSVTADDASARIFRSEDAGASWRGVPGTRSISITRMAFVKGGPALLVGTAGAGLWKSTDTGITFAQLKDPSGRMDAKAAITDMLVVPEAGRDAYLAAYYQNKGRVLELAGMQFTERYFTPLDRVQVTGIVRDPLNRSRLFISSSDGGFLESNDAGGTWKLRHQFTEGAVLLVANPHVAGMMWVAGGRGAVLRTDDYGQTWADSQTATQSLRYQPRTGYSSTQIQGLYVDPVRDILYRASAEGLTRSSDHGATWNPVNLPLLPGSIAVTAFAIDPVHPSVTYVSAGAQLYKTADGGESWKGTDFGGKRKIMSIVIDPKNTRVVIIGFE